MSNPFNSMRGMMDGGYSAGLRNNEHFPSPFLDMASTALPENNRNALQWCEYIFQANGTYRQAMERIIAYFLTDIEIGSAGDEVGDDEKEKWDDLLRNQLHIIDEEQVSDRNLMCFHGDTKAVTRTGIFKLRELVGRTVDVLSEGGNYRSAEFKSFGKQELYEVEFSDGRTLLATEDHEWIARNCSGKMVRIPTVDLPGKSVPRTVAPRPERGEEYREGVRHGFTFGDGSHTNGGKQSVAYFFGAKDAAVIPYFEGFGTGPQPESSDRDVTVIYGLPTHYKQLPANESSAEYWYGFVSGFLAADGSCDLRDGCTVLTQKSKATLDAIVDQLPRIGMSAGPVRGHWRKAEFIRRDGSVDVYEGIMHYVTILKQTMQPEDFLLYAHRDNFKTNYKPTNYGKMIGVRDVRPTGIVDEVFCCVEMETHSFVVGHSVLTGNCYGNDFKTFVIPFTRFLHCPKCRNVRFKLDHVYGNKQFKFKFSNFEFIASCPACHYRGAWNVKDEPENRPEKLKLKSWSPHEIQILNDPFTDECAYLWQIPEDYKNLVRQGKLYHLERVSKQVLEAIKHNKMFKFAPNVMFHMKEPALAGVRNRGWGISRLISNFRQVWYVQVLHRYNESIALDYVIPFRLITPAPRPGAQGQSGDILLNANMGDQMSQIRNMVRRRRRDPAGWNTLGFPVEYQALGGDATQLAPHELLNQGLDTMLNASGCPVELYKGTLQLQTAPVSLRLFEATWHHLVHQNNNFLRWVVERVSEILNWESVEARHRRVQHADDMQRHMAILQLAMGGQISLTTALRTLGLEHKDEERLIMEEARMKQETQAEVQEEMEQAAFGAQIAAGAPAGGMPGAGPPGAPMDPAMAGGGGMPPGGGMGGAPTGVDPTTGQPMGAGPVSQMMAPGGAGLPTTPEEMMQQAQSIANELLGLPETQKDSELRQLKDKNQVLHDLVRSEMDRIRSQAKSQGGAQLMAQQYGG